jgi:hypothetical protein
MRRIAPQLRLIRRRSWGSNASTLRRFHPLDGRRWRFRNVGPACRSTNLSLPRPFSSGDRFVQPLHLSCIGRLRRIEDVIASRLGGLISRRRSDRSDSSRSIDPALGFVLLQGCGRVGHCCVGTTSAILARNIRGLVTAGDSSVPGPLVTGPSAPGFAAPFLRRCDRNLVRLHPLARSRFSLAPASPALQRFVRLTPRQSNRSEPRWN